MVNKDLVSRPGLDPGTLGFVCESSGPSLKVQIYWSKEVGRSPTSSEILPSLISWLDEWLVNGSCTGIANVRFESVSGEVIELPHGSGVNV
jgi:hypothetical protein